MLMFPRELPTQAGGPVNDMNNETEALLRQHFRSKPIRIVWGMKDRVLHPGLVDSLWLDTFPDAEVTRIDDAGHFVQEDAYERIVPELIRFVDEL